MSSSTDDVYPLSLLSSIDGELGDHGPIDFEPTMVQGLMPSPLVVKVRIQAFFHRVGSVGLRAKIAGMVPAVVVGLGLTGSLVVRSNLTRVLERNLEAHAGSVAHAVAPHHEDAMSAQTGVPSHRLIQAMVDTDPE